MIHPVRSCFAFNWEIFKMSRPIEKQTMLVKNIGLSIYFPTIAGREQIFGQLEVNVVKCHV